MRLNPFPNKPWFLLVCHTNLLLTLWEKEKLLIMSNFSFSDIVFYHFGELFTIFIKANVVVYKLFQFRRAENLLFGKDLTLSQTSPGFYVSAEKVFLKTLREKEKLLLTVWRALCHFSTNLKLSSANSFNLEETKLCRLGKD